MIFAEAKKFVDEKFGYDVLVEVNLVGYNDTDDEIKEYLDIVFDYSNEIGHDAHRINKLTKELQ